MGFLQKLFHSERPILKRSNFFETLKSVRRLRLCEEVGRLLYEIVKRTNRQADPFKSFSVLDGYDIYAGDGHYHAAAVHDVRKSGKKYPTQHFYCADLRSHALNQLTLADTKGNRKRDHDLHALKRLDITTLRQEAPKGRKVIYVWDRAVIDFLQWRKWKQAGGVYFISREKKNLASIVMADLDYDRKDQVNAGVRSYELVGCCVGIAMHRVVYKCPLTGKTYRFITSLTNIPPGVIAYLYKTRWDLEKILDLMKNKLAEKKAWATSDTAKNIQAQFICMAHNQTRTVTGEYFLWLLMQHVLPRGFRKTRCYGFLHPCSKKVIRLLQLILRFDPSMMLKKLKPRAKITCKYCGAKMSIIRTMIPSARGQQAVQT